MGQTSRKSVCRFEQITRTVFAANKAGDLTMAYSLTEAAKAAGRTRQAIQAAIKKGTISAKKDPLGQWEIDPAELHRVYPHPQSLAANDALGLTLADAKKDAQIRELQARLEALRELKERIEREAEDLREDRNYWRLQARALPPPEKETASPLPPSPAEEKQKRSGFLKRLFGFNQ